jgi:hypothetical protein
MLSRIFDQETGRINDEITEYPLYASIVSAVRQICLAFKKIKLPCTPEREKMAVEGFIANELSFQEFSLSDEARSRFSNVAFVLWNRVLRGLRVDMLSPRHGPGQTAERRSGNRKYVWQRWHERLEPFFPFAGSAYSPSVGEMCTQHWVLNYCSFTPAEEEQPVRVVLVPKTLKGPRVIAIEPCCMQYVQQAVRNELYRRFESTYPFKGHVNFSDQGINQALAMASSIDGRLATIDLSDASDRVPLDLAMEMFRSNPDLHDLILACRSTRAELPGTGEILFLNKFASMGSALCFPVEAMYFYTICVIALLESRNLPVSRKNVVKCASEIFVYGDDILVPVPEAASVLDHLQMYNCKVNTSKTFYSGKFRESCGVDAYAGYMVTPVYLGTAPPENRQQASRLISWIATANQFAKNGYQRVAHVLFEKVEGLLGQLPPVDENSPVLGRISSWYPCKLRKRWNKVLQRMEVNVWTPRPVYRTDVLSGYAALMKCLIRLEGRIDPAASWEGFSFNMQDDTQAFTSLVSSLDVKHLERSALHGEVAINRRWVPATLIAGYRQ